MFYGMLSGFIFGEFTGRLFGYSPSLLFAVCGAAGAIIGGCSASDLFRAKCLLCVQEVDGTETQCFWYAQHEGRCSFEVPCAGLPGEACVKHYGHEGPCLSAREAGA
jgi:hypothetical protein